MKKINHILTILFVLMVFFVPKSVFATNGTEVKGVISVNSVWEKAKGPYLITDNLLIDTNALLTIEAGTEIIFEGNYYIKVLGNLQINGTSNNKVSFSSSERWNSITINSNDNIINYCIFSNGNKALLLDWQTRNNTIKGCDFLNNNYAIELGYSDSNSISNCNFDKNTTAIKNSASDRNIISGCIFNENTNGIVTNRYYYTNTNNVSGKCRNNTYTNNEFSKNKVVALDLSAEVNYKVLKSQLYENGIGLKVNNGNNSEYDWYAQVNNCNIWNNDTNVQASGSYKDTYDFTNNYWGTENGVEISSKIYDFYDDFNLGKVIYEPYLTVPYGSNLVNSNHSSGEYDNEILVELSVANGGDIYYTLDGTDPILNGVKYNSPITVSQDLIISCVSCLNNVYSDIVSYEYKITEPITDYTIKELYLSDFIGELIGDGKTIPQSGKFFANISVVKNASSNEKDLLFIATYTDNGQLIDYNIMSGTYNQNQEITFSTTLDNTDGNIGKIKTFIWNSLTSLKPLSNSLCIE